VALRRLLGVALVAAATLLAACGGGEPDLVVYSGRAEPLIKPFLEEFAQREKLDVRVRFGDTADLVGTLLEEGARTRADVFIGQDAAALAKLDAEGLLRPYRGARRTPARYRARDGSWTGLSGRARVLIVRRGVEAPRSVFDLTEPRWRGRVAAPDPRNVSFRDWVSTIRLERGDAFARRYLEGLERNELAVLADHGQVRNAVGEGEFDVGLVNHYYVELERREGSPVRAVYTDQERGGFGTPFNVASAGITRSAAHPENAGKLLDYLLTPSVQRRFASANFEYPLLPGLEAAPGVRPLGSFRVTGVPLERLGAAADGTDRLLDEVDLGG
jgi:iron(III) transport system substrate-binding protein